MPVKRQKRSGRSKRSRKGNIGLVGGDASDWVTKNFGTGNQQWWNTFGPKSLGIETGNLLPTVVGAPAVLPGMTPQGQNVGAYTLKSLMSGGRTRGVKPHRMAKAYPELQAILQWNIKLLT